MQSSNQWSENYQQILDDLTFDIPPRPSRTTLGPKASISKPIKRRPKAKAPTTLLTADANNFRALVQQFTGCNTAAPPFGPYRGPINLNFESCSYYPKNVEMEAEKRLECNNLHEESDDRLLTLVSRVDGSQNPRSDALTCYDWCDDQMDRFWLEGLLGTMNDELWGD